MSGSVSNWARFQLTKHPFYFTRCNMSSEAVPLRLRLLQTKGGYQQLMFITQHSSDTVDGKLSPTVNALLSGGQEFLRPLSYWTVPWVTFHFELCNNAPVIVLTETSGNLPFQLQPDLSVAITVKYYLKEPRQPCVKQPKVISARYSSARFHREVHLTQETSPISRDAICLISFV